MDGVDRGSPAPFRQAELRTRCALCHELTDGATCLRCGRPLCAQHLPPPDRRCAPCEEQFARDLERAQRRARRVFWTAGAVYISLCAVGGVLTWRQDSWPTWAGALFGISPVGVAVAFLVYSVRLQRTARRSRRHFLAARPSR
jgi:hypothetical protein